MKIRQNETQITRNLFQITSVSVIFLTKEDKTRSFLFFQSIYKNKIQIILQSIVPTLFTYRVEQNTMANIADLTLAIASTGPNGRQTSDSIDYNERKTIHDYDYESKYDSDSEYDYGDSDYDDDEDSDYDIASELNEHGQGTDAKEKGSPIFLKRIIDLDQDAQMEIAKLKTLIPNGTEKKEAISLLETFSVNDWYEDRKKRRKDGYIDRKNVV